jgi:Replication-relaxation
VTAPRRPNQPATRARAGRAGTQPAPPRNPASADLALLASRLTDRDHRLCRLLHEHRVLTTSQLRELAFGSLNVAQHRLVALARLGVLERFRPVWPHGGGSAPWHYVLGPAGAAVLAAEQASTPAQLSYRRDRVLAIAYSQRLGHQIGVNGFFTALAARARRHPDGELLAWLSERACAERWGHVVRPDGYGRWRDPDGEVDFFLEYDTGTEPLDRLLAKVDAYAELATATEIDTPVLLWLPGPGREAALHQTLGRPQVTLATAAARLAGHPAGRVWLVAGEAGPRRTLASLGELPA